MSRIADLMMSGMTYNEAAAKRDAEPIVDATLCPTCGRSMVPTPAPAPEWRECAKGQIVGERGCEKEAECGKEKGGTV